nr:LptF/LptG family permease [bacterium]
MQAKTEGYFSRYLPDLELDPVGSKGRERPITLPLQLAPLLAENQRLRQELSADNNFIDGLDRKNYQLLVEIHKKYSIPVACLVFVLIGAPLGMMARRGSMTMAAGLSFGFFLLYWASLIGGEELADNQIISPFVAMWLADLLVGAVGLYLLLSAVRESTLFNPAAVRTFFERFRRKSRRGLRASAAEDAY